MTGKTHIAISAASVAVLLAVTETAARASGASTPAPGSAPSGSGSPVPDAYSIAGLLLLGIVAGLFPDLDAPDSELHHLPWRAAWRVGRAWAWCLPASTRRPSIPGTAGQALVHLASVPFTLLLLGTSTALRAFTGHRGFTHTLWGALTFTTLATALAMLLTGSLQSSAKIAAVWLVGYASHLAADACTPSGIPLFGNSGSRVARRGPGTSAPRPAPYSRSPSFRVWVRRSPRTPFHLLPDRMLIRTGTPADTLLVRWGSWVVFVAALAALYTERYTGLG
jgi:membrane-bound metal-dependent hydrolase YbcI (DUF457 family)